MRALRNRGDTIVEVMVVLAILGFAISISYSSASRSLADSEQSEQNSYATELAQSQVEEIRAMVDSSTEDASTGSISGLAAIPVVGGSQVFCMNGSTVDTYSTANCQPNPATAINYVWTDTLTQTATGNPAIPYVNSFEVEVVWPDALGQGQDTVTLFYRVYPPQQST